MIIENLEMLNICQRVIFENVGNVGPLLRICY